MSLGKTCYLFSLHVEVSSFRCVQVWGTYPAGLIQARQVLPWSSIPSLDRRLSFPQNEDLGGRFSGNVLEDPSLDPKNHAKPGVVRHGHALWWDRWKEEKPQKLGVGTKGHRLSSDLSCIHMYNTRPHRSAWLFKWARSHLSTSVTDLCKCVCGGWRTACRSWPCLSPGGS